MKKFTQPQTKATNDAFKMLRVFVFGIMLCGIFQFSSGATICISQKKIQEEVSSDSKIFLSNIKSLTYHYGEICCYEVFNFLNADYSLNWIAVTGDHAKYFSQVGCGFLNSNPVNFVAISSNHGTFAGLAGYETYPARADVVITEIDEAKDAILLNSSENRADEVSEVVPGNDIDSDLSLRNRCAPMQDASALSGIGKGNLRADVVDDDDLSNELLPFDEDCSEIEMAEIEVNCMEDPASVLFFSENTIPATVMLPAVPLDPVCSGTTTICSGASANISATSSGATSIYWFTSGCATSGQVFTSSPGAAYPVSPASTTIYYARGYNASGFSLNCCTVTITVTATPGGVAVNGPGTYCDSKTLTATGGTSGTIYWQGTTSGGTSTALATTAYTVTSSGTYYFRAYNQGCWGNQSSAAVTIYPSPDPVTVYGAGAYCGSHTLTATGGTDGTIYWQGTTSGGTSTLTPATSQTVSSSNTYYFRAYNTSCGWGTQGSAAVTITTIPGAVTAYGDGTYCDSKTLTATGGTNGTIYWQGTTSNGTSTGTPTTTRAVTSSGTYYFRAGNLGCW
ncbi:MAG TPA: hypothetical protein PKW80_16255, partial [Bacteroidales bacterium]|nr:hypothetical protein [Bacteroidales bacterium]